MRILKYLISPLETIEFIKCVIVFIAKVFIISYLMSMSLFFWLVPVKIKSIIAFV